MNQLITISDLVGNQDTFILAFVMGVMYRAISGLQNAYGYAKSLGLMWLATNIVILGIWVSAAAFIGKIWILILLLVGTFGIVMVGVAFRYRGKYDIHFWEMVEASAFQLVIIFINPLAGILSVYPGLLLHKGFINLSFHKPFLYHGTEDPEGKFFTVFGIKIPRLPRWWRLVAAGLSTILFIGLILFYYAKH